jgi:hypothetical protein
MSLYTTVKVIPCVASASKMGQDGMSQGKILPSPTGKNIPAYFHGNHSTERLSHEYL